MSRRKKALIYITILIVVFSGIFIYTNQKRDKAIAVKTAIAGKGDIKSYLSTTATIESRNSKQYYGIQAKINKVAVSVGDKVKIGQVLVVYDTTDVETAVKQAKIQYDNAILQRDDLYKQNNSIIKKINELSNTISSLQGSPDLQNKAKAESYKQQKDSLVQISTEKLKLSDNAVSLAKLAYESAKKKQADNNSVIYSQSNGVVTALNAEQGTIGSMMQPAVEVQDVENLKAVVALGKYDANKIKLGQSVIIKNGDRKYRGKVTSIGPVATKSLTQAGNDVSLNAEITVLDKNTDLKIAFDVDVDILIGQKNNVLNVPAECIKPEKENKNLVYIVDGNIVREKAVKLGLRSDTDVEIIQGMKQGDRVVLNPSGSIANGVKVKED